MKFDIVIAGGGISGLCLGYWLRRIVDVVILEEHDVVGYPMHCTGLVGSSVIPLLPVKPQIIGRYDTIRICDLKGHCVTFGLKGDKAYMIERPLLEARLAEELGNIVRTGIQVLDYHKGVVYSKRTTFRCNAFVIAEGARLWLTKRHLPWNPRIVYGVQSDVRLDNGEMPSPNEILVIFDPIISENFFAWIVPREDGLCRVGLANSKSPFERLGRLLNRLRVSRIERIFGGIIITGGSPRRVAKGRIALIGDAGGFVKYTTGGGIWLGVLGSLTLSLCVEYALKHGLQIENAFSAFDLMYRRFFLKRLITYDLISGLMHGPLRPTLQNALVELSGMEFEARSYDDHFATILNVLLRHKRLMGRILSDLHRSARDIDEAWLKELVRKAFYTIIS